MRKTVFLLILAGLCLAALPGLCQVLTFENILATVEIPDSYTILTPDNMENYVSFLQSKGTAVDVMLQTFEAEGILVQAYGPEGDTCLQISALNDLDAQTYFDIDQHTSTDRARYRRAHLDGDAYKALGVSYDSAEWRNTTAYGRFLMLKYVQRIGGAVDHRGFARRTIRNGYTITVDYQVYGRSLASKDNNALNKVMDTWHFTSVLPLPGTDAEGGAGAGAGTPPTASTPTATLRTAVTGMPPTETNAASFTVKGKTTPGAEVIGSVLRMNTAEPLLIDDTADRSGNFSLAVKLPQEGVYVMVLTVTVNGEAVEEISLPEITYNKGLLPVTFDEAFPSQLTSDKLVISGKSVSGAVVQCLVNGENTQKRVGSNGKFSFSISTAKEGDYSFVLVFTKKGLDDQRFSFTATREWSDSELREKVKAEAIKPAHTVLTSKINGYTGRVMGYTAYVTKIEQTGDGGWQVYMAFRKVNSVYRDLIIVMADTEPPVMVDSKAKMYGRCTGMYLVQDVSGSTEYPSFDLLFWDNE